MRILVFIANQYVIDIHEYEIQITHNSIYEPLGRFEQRSEDQQICDDGISLMQVYIWEYIT